MQASLDQWTSLFLFASGQGIFLSVILCSRNKEKFQLNWPLALVVFLFSLTLVQYVLFWSKYLEQIPYLTFLPEFGFYCFGPLILIYLQQLFNREKASRLSALHFIPAVLILCLIAIYWTWYGQKISLPIFKLLGTIGVKLTYHWLIAGHLLIYALAIGILIYKNSEKEENPIKLRWSKMILALFTMFILAYSSYYVLVNFSFFNSKWDYLISITMSVGIYGIGYMGFNRPEIFSGELMKPVFSPEKYKSSQLTAALSISIFEKVQHYFSNNQPFLDNSIRLSDIAKAINCNKHHLSQVINEHSGKNFNQFVNDYRLEYVSQILQSGQDISIKEIFYDSGFNNKTTFNNAFKSKFGCTPSQFRKQSKV